MVTVGNRNSCKPYVLYAFSHAQRSTTITAHPAKPLPCLADAAKDGQLLLVRCNMCKRSHHFLAADLLAFLNPKHPLHRPSFPCLYCRSTEYVSMKVHMPRAGAYSRLPTGSTPFLNTFRCGKIDDCWIAFTEVSLYEAQTSNIHCLSSLDVRSIILDGSGSASAA